MDTSRATNEGQPLKGAIKPSKRVKKTLKTLKSLKSNYMHYFTSCREDTWKEVEAMFKEIEDTLLSLAQDQRMVIHDVAKKIKES